MLDIGTGDGRFVLDQAKSNPEILCIGIDASRDGLIEASQKALKTLKKGGVSNALFVLSSIEALPAELCNLADIITINYPWGSLLHAVTKPDRAILQKIAAIGKAGSSLKMLLNWSVFENESYCERLGLPKLTLANIENQLRRPYEEAGITILSHGLVTSSTTSTTWGKKLVKGSARSVLSLEAQIR